MGLGKILGGLVARAKARNRDNLDGRQNIAVLEKTKDKLAEHNPATQFSIRTAIAAALNDLNFDDSGVGCKQEKNLTHLVGQAIGLLQPNYDEIERRCQAMSSKDLQAALSTATRYT